MDASRYVPGVSFAGNGIPIIRRLSNQELLDRYSLQSRLDNTYSSFLFGDLWLIKRIPTGTGSNSAVSYANQLNNPTITSLEAAESGRVTLVYELIDDVEL